MSSALRRGLPTVLLLIVYASKPNRALVEQDVAILRANGALATQRGPEIQRLHLKQLEEIGVTACDTSCPPSADILGISMPDQGVNPATVDCAVVLNMPLIQQQAREWSAPGGDVTALVLVHEQEHCLRLPEDDRETPSGTGSGDRAQRSPMATRRRTVVPGDPARISTRSHSCRTTHSPAPLRAAGSGGR